MTKPAADLLDFTPAELAKFEILASGLRLTEEANRFIGEANAGRPITTADYASTSGVILKIDGDIWVNAPTRLNNPNVVQEERHTLDRVDDQLVLVGPYGIMEAAVWLQPEWHSWVQADGLPFTRLGVSHTDRVRVSPIEGCAFTCTFCDLPYEFRYRTKRVEDLVETARLALDDPVQPASHILISGGTPRPADYGYVREAYEAIITSFPDTATDIMMVPLREVLDLAHLAKLGLREVSINLEVWDDAVARRVMPRKHKQGREYYLDFLSDAAEILGGGRVRSMLMLGIEPLEATLEGVAAIAERGCVPVLSPFRADPITPLRDWPVPHLELLTTAYSRAWQICQEYGVALGPPCRPCAHNTLTLPASGGHGSATMSYGSTRTVS